MKDKAAREYVEKVWFGFIDDMPLSVIDKARFSRSMCGKAMFKEYWRSKRTRQRAK